MADVRAVRGVRFRGAQARHLGHLIAPPYDVGSADLLARLRDLSPYNMVHLEHVAPGDRPADHAAAAARYRAWLREGVLAADDAPAFYRYDQTFDVDGHRLGRRGLFARVRLAAWDERVVRPHEATFARARLERQHHLAAVRANLSPLFLLYRDPDDALGATLDGATGATVADTEDVTGSAHRLTRLDDPVLIGRVEGFFRDAPLYVADGHHRYEAALAYRDERRAAAGPRPDPDAPFEFVLACLVAADDPGLLVLPTHRLLRGLPDLDAALARARLAESFDLRPCPLPPTDASEELIDRLLPPDSDAVAAVVFAGEADAWQLRPHPDAPHPASSVREADESHRHRQASGPVARHAALDVARLDAAVQYQILGPRHDRVADHLRYHHDAHAALSALARGDGQAVFLLRATAVGDILAVADLGATMSAKSTYFHPKIPAGLVIHDLDS